MFACVYLCVLVCVCVYVFMSKCVSICVVCTLCLDVVFVFGLHGTIVFKQYVLHARYGHALAYGLLKALPQTPEVVHVCSGSP